MVFDHLRCLIQYTYGSVRPFNAPARTPPTHAPRPTAYLPLRVEVLECGEGAHDARGHLVVDLVHRQHRVAHERIPAAVGCRQQVEAAAGGSRGRRGHSGSVTIRAEQLVSCGAGKAAHGDHPHGTQVAAGSRATAQQDKAEAAATPHRTALACVEVDRGAGKRQEERVAVVGVGDVEGGVLMQVADRRHVARGVAAGLHRRGKRAAAAGGAVRCGASVGKAASAPELVTAEHSTCGASLNAASTRRRRPAPPAAQST